VAIIAAASNDVVESEAVKMREQESKREKQIVAFIQRPLVIFCRIFPVYARQFGRAMGSRLRCGCAHAARAAVNGAAVLPRARTSLRLW